MSNKKNNSKKKAPAKKAPEKKKEATAPVKKQPEKAAPKPKEKPKKAVPSNGDDDRLNITKSVFEVNRELREKQLREQEERQEELRQKYLEREKKKQEAYERRILEEKKELIRMKQGIVEESEMIPEEHSEAVVLSPGKKIANFFYHNKWWLGIGIVFVAILSFLIINLVKKPHPDLVVLVITDNGEIGLEDGVAKYIEQFTEDVNNNGEILVDIHYIPLSDNKMLNYQNGSDNKLTFELQSADGMIVIGDSKFLELIKGSDTLADASELYPDNINIHSGAFYLKNTGFSERIGLDEKYIPNDMFIAMRKPQKLLYADEDEMQEAYDKSLPVFQKIIEDLSR